MYGILRKGPGLCHGVAGNGYCFLTLYRLTRDFAWLLRAHGFASLLPRLEGQYPGEPDRPLSLYEGIAGTMCFVEDLRTPEEARFPLFEI